MTPGHSPRPALTLVHGSPEATPVVEWSWFCGHCAAAPHPRIPPSPSARVCSSCGLGLLLEAPSDVIPDPRDAFLVIDGRLLVQAMSVSAEQLLDVSEETAVDRPVVELLVPADAEAGRTGALAAAITDAAGGSDRPTRVFLRPWNTFGVRMCARIAPCGPPRAALLVLETRPRELRVVDR